MERHKEDEEQCQFGKCQTTYLNHTEAEGVYQKLLYSQNSGFFKSTYLGTLCSDGSIVVQCYVNVYIANWK